MGAPAPKPTHHELRQQGNAEQDADGRDHVRQQTGSGRYRLSRRRCEPTVGLTIQLMTGSARK